ncbi:alpha/beta-hydrolase [Tuber magnatum]|uniref:Alpha/beta-hydrolase n=1 Tax=Tuber magnatum TaxID=42249 RepID=A0A317SN69_9PEZI|nr:alpha/beta-hydrolase [Tuber magnatum]
MIDMWLARHTPENTMPIIEKVLRAVKETYADKAYDSSMGVLAIGYCFGAKYVLRLAATDGIVAGAVAHGLLISQEDIAGVKKPVTLACVENDIFFPDEVRDGGRKQLQDNNVDHELRIYPGVPHGFAVYGSYFEDHIKIAQKQAFDQFLEFLNKH